MKIKDIKDSIDLKRRKSANFSEKENAVGNDSANHSVEGNASGDGSANRSFEGDVEGDNSALYSFKGKVNVGKGSVGIGRHPGDKPQGENSVMALTDNNQKIVKIVIRAGDDVEVEFI